MANISYRSGLPKSIATKIYKTGQTRGAEKDEIYQNRVLRNSTVLIPYSCWNNGAVIPEKGFENGYIVLISPEDYFEKIDNLPKELVLGQNLLVFYETRNQWTRYPIKQDWTFATSRTAPLMGQYVARIPDTTSDNHSEIRHGFTDAKTGGQGAGIRFYEYADKDTIQDAYYQLAYLAWHTRGIKDLCSTDDIDIYVNHVKNYCESRNLLDLNKMKENRLIKNNETICPLCLEPIKALELASRAEQMEGRATIDLTVTKANLFHNIELRPGEYNHCTYNLGWGHYHCNTVTRDSGIMNTLEWMKQVLHNNNLI